MLFRRCAKVSDAQIETAGDIIQEACTEKKLQGYLDNWGPWIQYGRKKLVIPYENLETTSHEGERKCSLTCEETTQPVVYAEKIYDYESFIKNYIVRGTDRFTQSLIDFSDLKRIKY